MAYRWLLVDKLKQAIGNLAAVEVDANASVVTQPVDLARCAEATRLGFEAVLTALEAFENHGHENLRKYGYFRDMKITFNDCPSSGATMATWGELRRWLDESRIHLQGLETSEHCVAITINPNGIYCHWGPASADVERTPNFGE